jgi:hypothetical protein
LIETETRVQAYFDTPFLKPLPCTASCCAVNKITDDHVATIYEANQADIDLSRSFDILSVIRGVAEA